MEQQSQPQTAAPVVARISREEFDAMSPAERRVAIARDVIAQVGARTLRARRGSYLSPIVLPSPDAKVEDVVTSTPCFVCGIGAAFVSSVRLFDEVDEGAFDVQALGFAGRFLPGEDDEEWDDSPVRDWPMFAHLARFFDFQQLGLIEAAFEMDMGFAERMGVGDEDALAAVLFGREARGSADRLCAIMQNIINHGEFRPGAAVAS